MASVLPGIGKGYQFDTRHDTVRSLLDVRDELAKSTPLSRCDVLAGISSFFYTWRTLMFAAGVILLFSQDWRPSMFAASMVFSFSSTWYTSPFAVYVLSIIGLIVDTLLDAWNGWTVSALVGSHDGVLDGALLGVRDILADMALFPHALRTFTFMALLGAAPLLRFQLIPALHKPLASFTMSGVFISLVRFMFCPTPATDGRRMIHFSKLLMGRRMVLVLRLVSAMAQWRVCCTVALLLILTMDCPMVPQ